MDGDITVLGVEVHDPTARGDDESDADQFAMVTNVLLVVEGFNADGQKIWGYASSENMTLTDRIGFLTQLLDRYRSDGVRGWMGRD